MRTALGRIIDENWIVALACGSALAYATLIVAEAVGQTITRALESGSDSIFGDAENGTLAFRIGSHLVDLAPLWSSLIAFAIVLTAAVGVLALTYQREDEPPEVA
jgi:hypothetical protein